MKIVINNENRLLFCNGAMIKPGTNTFDEFEVTKTVKSWIDEGMLEVHDSEEMDDSDIRNAIRKSNSQDVVKELEALAESENVKEVAENKVKELDEAEAMLDKEIEKAKEAKKKKAASAAADASK